MPRGNDAEAAGRELQAKIDVPLNAEEMIKENAARWPRELRTANLRPVNDRATEELGDDGAQALVGDDQIVLGYAVRGPFVVVVSEHEDTGVVTKQAFPHEGHEKEAERFSEPAEEDAEKADAEAIKEQEEAHAAAEKAAEEEAKAAEKSHAGGRRAAAAKS